MEEDIVKAKIKETEFFIPKILDVVGKMDPLTVIPALSSVIIEAALTLSVVEDKDFIIEMVTKVLNEAIESIKIGLNDENLMNEIMDNYIDIHLKNRKNENE